MSPAFSLGAWWPALLLLALPLLGWVARRSARGQSSRHLQINLALRAITLILLAAALMRPVYHRATQELSVVYALDVSHSVAPEFLQSALTWMEANAGRADKSAYLAFADRPEVTASATALRDIRLGEHAGALDRRGTNVERALDEALGLFDADQSKHLVLLSDGNANRGDVWRVVPRLQAAGVRVFVLPALPRAGERDAWIDAVYLPPGLRAFEPVDAVLRVTSRSASSAMVRISAGGRQLAATTVRLRSGWNRIVLPLTFTQPGQVMLTASVVVDGDDAPENNEFRVTAQVGAKARVLYVEGETASARFFAEALSKQGMSVDAAPLPAERSRLNGYDAVVLSDVPYQQLAPGAIENLVDYVRTGGGGLVFAAGEHTYGEDAYAGSAVERLLPAEFKAREKRQDLALMLCLDRSFSMRGQRLELAKTAAYAALDMLEESHRFGVISFDSQPYITVQLQPASAKEQIQPSIARLQAGGQTSIGPALETALALLKRSTAKSKHIILLTDGDSHPTDFETLVKKLQREQITLSTVAAGEDVNQQLLADLARWGKGRFYYAKDMQQVPQIFISETDKALRSGIHEEPFRLLPRRQVFALRGIDLTSAPPLRGHISTLARPQAEVLADASEDSPALLRWHVGQGKVLLFASDVKNRWAADWLGWPGYAKFWGQLVRDVTRRQAPEFEFTAAAIPGGASLVLTGVDRDGNVRTDLKPRVRVTTGAGDRVELELRQEAPGMYRAEWQGNVADARFALVPGGDLSNAVVTALGSREVPVNYPDEFRGDPPDFDMLRALARETGGKYAATATDVFADYGDRGRKPVSLWPGLLGAALLLYLADIALRRGAWFWRKLGASAVIPPVHTAQSAN